MARTGHWLLRTPEESPGDLDKQVAALFTDLSDDLDAWKALTWRFRGNIFVGLFLSTFNEGVSLSPNTLSAIGLRGLELALDVYSGRDDEKIV